MRVYVVTHHNGSVVGVYTKKRRAKWVYEQLRREGDLVILTSLDLNEKDHLNVAQDESGTNSLEGSQGPKEESKAN